MKNTTSKKKRILFLGLFIFVLITGVIGYLGWTKSEKKIDYAYNTLWLDKSKSIKPLPDMERTSSNITANPSDAEYMPLIMLDGNAEMLITNPIGKKLGLDHGKYIDEISDAKSIFNRSPFVNTKQYYNFSQDTDLKAEITGTTTGTYDLVKMKGDEIIRVLNVPTAENIKDTINVSDDNVSIKFGNEANRSGEYHLNITKNQAGVIQFEGTNLPVLTGTAIRYGFNWDTLSAGGNGITIDIDKNSDGTIDSTSVVSSKFNGKDIKSMH